MLHGLEPDKAIEVLQIILSKKVWCQHQNYERRKRKQNYQRSFRKWQSWN